MFSTDRRSFLRFLSNSALAAALPESIDRALAIPAHNEMGSIEDVEHIVILMQENQYALAEAFTICDAYHCSLLGSTDPNRYHMWTGWCGNDGAGGGPVVDNSEAGYGWHIYPERLEQAGISWKIYQDVGDGLDAAGFWGWTGDPYIGNYGDNSLLYFHQYQNALPGEPLYEKARRGTNIKVGGTLFDILKEDVRQNKLPQVSWIASPEAFSEHSNWPPNYGAWYISQVLDALTSNPRLWSKTVFFITYDENDGFFDHVMPPTPARSLAEGKSTVSTINEIYPGNGGSYEPGPYGLGNRVPMIVVSPWSKGDGSARKCSIIPRSYASSSAASRAAIPI